MCRRTGGAPGSKPKTKTKTGIKEVKEVKEIKEDPAADAPPAAKRKAKGKVKGQVKGQWGGAREGGGGWNKGTSRMLSFTAARAIARKLKLGSQREWLGFCKSGDRPLNIPANPDREYRDDGWVSFPDWLGYKGREVVKMLRFAAARAIVRKQKLKSEKEWREWGSQRPSHIPANPRRVYRDHGWISTADWLGYGSEGDAGGGSGSSASVSSSSASAAAKKTTKTTKTTKTKEKKRKRPAPAAPAAPHSDAPPPPPLSSSQPKPKRREGKAGGKAGEGEAEEPRFRFTSL
jgi:hypothetical protein